MSQLVKASIARWQSRGGKYWIELFEETIPGHDFVPSYSYSGNGCGGFIGSPPRADAIAYCEQQASYSPSKCPRIR